MIMIGRDFVWEKKNLHKKDMKLSKEEDTYEYLYINI